MSGTQVSSFAPANILFDAASGATTASVQNQLLRNDLLAKLAPYQVQQAQQQTGEAETEMMARAASGLLSMPDEASRAAAYPSAVADLQRLGFAKNAPSIYPGETTLRRVAAMGIPSAEQWKYGQGQKALDAVYPGPGASAASGPDPVAGMPREQALDALATRESGNKNVPNAEGASTASGYWQMLDSTWKEAAKLASIDVSKYPRAMDAPWMAQRAAAGALFDKYGATPWAASAPKGGTAIAAATPLGGPPQATPGVAAPLAPVQVAGPGAPTQATPTAAPATDLVGPRPLPPIGPASPVVTPQMIANTPAPAAVAPPAPVVAAPAAPQVAPPAPQTANPQLDRNYLTPEDHKAIAGFKAALVASGSPQGPQLLQAEIDRRANFNLQREQHAQQQAHQAMEDERQRQSDARAQAEAAVKQQEAGRKSDPFAGEGETAAANRTLRDLRPAILDGSATDEQRSNYALAAAHYTKPTLQAVPDPDRPGATMMAYVKGEMPYGFPLADYKPVSADKTQVQSVQSTAGVTPVPGTGKAVELTQDQARAATYADRMVNSHNIMNQLDDAATSWAEKSKEKIGNWVGYSINSPDYQRVKQAQEDFINSTLRQESGAVINADEFIRGAHQYFPQPGDSPAVIEQKRKNREAEIAGFSREAGPAYKPKEVAKPSIEPPASQNMPLARTPGEAQQLAPGTMYRTPDGRTFKR